METLSERQAIILQRLVDAHIQYAQPVGSRLLTERFDMGYSPATVRHEMGYLEEMGYLTHPHTSSGRVPTDLGFRYYVDHSLFEEAVSLDQCRQWENEAMETVKSGFFFLNQWRTVIASKPDPVPIPSK